MQHKYAVNLDLLFGCFFLGIGFVISACVFFVFDNFILFSMINKNLYDYYFLYPVNVVLIFHLFKYRTELNEGDNEERKIMFYQT